MLSHMALVNDEMAHPDGNVVFRLLVLFGWGGIVEPLDIRMSMHISHDGRLIFFEKGYLTGSSIFHHVKNKVLAQLILKNKRF